MGKYALTSHSPCFKKDTHHLLSKASKSSTSQTHMAGNHHLLKSRNKSKEWNSKEMKYRPQSRLLLNRANRGAKLKQYLNGRKQYMEEKKERKKLPKKYQIIYQSSLRGRKPVKYCPEAMLKFVHRLKNPYLNLLAYKKCQECNQTRDDQLTNIIYCSICDDAFHRTCLQKRLSIDEVRAMSKWVCPKCFQNDVSSSDSSPEEDQKSISHLQDSQFPMHYGLYCDTVEWIIFQQRKFLKLFDLEEEFWTRRPTKSLRLKPFIPIEQNKTYWIPLIKALSTTNHLYSREQVYLNSQTLSLNKSINHRPEQVEMLSVRDQKAYEQFIELLKEGQAPPLTLQRCSIKGFLTRATGTIQPRTIISEYAGEVITYRKSLRILNNDSIFTLLETGNSETSLDVVPNKYCNISKYFLGINNSDIKNYEKVNVQSVLFSYKGRNRILFYTLRQIQKGEELYIDYNAGLADNYPTQNFK